MGRNNTIRGIAGDDGIGNFGSGFSGPGKSAGTKRFGSRARSAGSLVHMDYVQPGGVRFNATRRGRVKSCPLLIFRPEPLVRKALHLSHSGGWYQMDLKYDQKSLFRMADLLV
jgi:hypothetical protein